MKIGKGVGEFSSKVDHHTPSAVFKINSFLLKSLFLVRQIFDDPARYRGTSLIKKRPPPLRPLQDNRHRPTVGF